MADESQVAMLKRSVEEWNTWREQKESSKPGRDHAISLHGADLRHSNLAGANLTNAVLRKADLRHADLRHADFRGANLVWSRLDGSNLRMADFGALPWRGSKQVGAVMTSLAGANLTRCDLLLATFRFTTLFQADFTQAALGGTAFVDVDLSSTRGLATCVHITPSAVDWQTLLRSQHLPTEFLRGCGLPEQLIDYLPSLSSVPFQFYSCFISYSTRDQEFADRVHTDLQNKGVRCWFAPHDIAGGKKIHEQIDEAIRIYDRLLLILSDASMSSEWVKTEIANARQKELQQKRQVLFPISLVPFDRIREWRAFDADTGMDSAREIREYYIPDFSNWKDHDSYKAAFGKLLKGLKAEEMRQ